jgi:hypothetical protein
LAIAGQTDQTCGQLGVHLEEQAIRATILAKQAIEQLRTEKKDNNPDRV